MEPRFLEGKKKMLDKKPGKYPSKKISCFDNIIHHFWRVTLVNDLFREKNRDFFESGGGGGS